MFLMRFFHYIMTITFIDIVDYLGVFAFAVSGIRLAASHKFDLFGAYIVGTVTAIGGGTTRDLLLNITPFWVHTPSYFIIIALALLVVMLFDKYLIKFNETLFLFDAIGLGLFTVVGIDKALSLDFPFWVAVIMGMTTGAVGGVIRDIFINEIPLIFRKHIYAMACVFGGLVYYICYLLDLPIYITQIVSALTVIFIRVLAAKYRLSLPIVNYRYEDFK